MLVTDVLATRGARRPEPFPRWLIRLATIAYVVGVLALTTGPQPPGRLDIAGNILLTVPLGGLLALRWPRLHPAVVVLAGCSASCAIEGLQLFVLTARDASLNDIALNTSGTALGWIAGLTVADLVRRTRRPSRPLP